MTDIEIRPIEIRDCTAAQKLLNQTYGVKPYSRPMDAYEVQEQLIGRGLSTYYPMQWQQQVCLGAWQEREQVSEQRAKLVGMIDVSVGRFSNDAYGQPQIPHSQNIYHHGLNLLANWPVGLLRNLILPDDADFAATVATALLKSAEQFWREMDVDQIAAFHSYTGYPAFQAGIGLLNGDNRTQFQTLTAANYALGARYYRLRRLLDDPVDEEIPLADIQLTYQGDRDNRVYQLYRRKTEWIGQAHLYRAPLTLKREEARTAHIGQLYIESVWRRQGLGKWLLCRLINDATFQGYSEMLIHVPYDQHFTISMLVQEGFQELNYRGYTLSKLLGPL